MTQKQKRSGLESIEATVASLSRQASQVQAEEQAQAEGRVIGRGKPGNAGQVGRDKTGLTKATYALPITRQEMVREIAAEEDVSQTDIVEAAIVAFYNAWQAGQIDLSELKVTTKSLRVSWRLEIPDNFFCPQK